MTVNVITRHAPANYGSLLQAIATQRIIHGLGYDCKIIDYIPECETGVRVAFEQLKWKKEWNTHLVKKMSYLAVREPENILMYAKFAAMRKKYLIMGPHCSNKDELHNLYKNAKDDFFITGSDQVWGPISTGVYDSAYFLDFAPKKARRLAFASSFGKASFDKDVLEKYKKYLEKYDIITVRENTAVDIIRRMGINAQQILDPTLLMSKDEWITFISPLKKPSKYVLIYEIHKNPKLDEYAKKFAQNVRLPLIRISPVFHQIKRGGKFVYLPDIGGFLDLIKNATYMITDSFHGTIFAIVFNVQFIEVLPTTDTSIRNESILKLTGLTDRIANDIYDMKFMDQIIDFSLVNSIIAQEKDKSLKFLKHYLDNGNYGDLEDKWKID